MISALSQPVEVRDYYSFLQISPTAEPETIHRVYRFLAARFHPDNPETGDSETFLTLQRVFETLYDPVRRAEYDASLGAPDLQPLAPLEVSELMEDVDGEVKRRLAILSILYHRRRVNMNHPHVSLADLETRMSIPRDYLDFSIWYLKSKKYLTREDNADLALTVLGVDYIEENYETTPILSKLLSCATDLGAAPVSIGSVIPRNVSTPAIERCA